MQTPLFNSSEERYEHFLIACEGAGFKPSDKFLKWLNDNNFFTAPASTKYHGVYEGGLFDHCFIVAGRLQELTEKLDLHWQRPESPFIVGMFHDLCKCDQYIKVFDEEKEIEGEKLKITIGNKFHYEYNQNTILKEHGAKSVMILSQHLQLTEEEVLCIRYHMGAYQKEEWEQFDNAIHRYPNCLFAHTADMIASKIDDI